MLYLMKQDKKDLTEEQNNDLKRIMSFYEDLMRTGFYGIVSTRFQSGILHTIKTETTIKKEELIF